MPDDKYCEQCGGLMDGSEVYDDVCDDCASEPCKGGEDDDL